MALKTLLLLFAALLATWSALAQTAMTPEALDAEWKDCSALGLPAPCHTKGSEVGDITQSLADYISVKMFGAQGDGIHDDTANIQAAIDYAYAHAYQGVFCPKGIYKTTSSLYLDPPGNLRSSLANPTFFNFSLAFVGSDEGLGNPYSGCVIKPTFANAVAMYIGTGVGMKAANFSIIGPSSTTYRCNLDPNGVGLGLTGGNGGSSRNLVENVAVWHFYSGFKTHANANNGLNDSNSFRKIQTLNTCYGVYIYGFETAIDDIQEAELGFSTTSVYNPFALLVSIVGGNLSNETAKSNSFSISAVSSLSTTANPNLSAHNDYTFTAVIASPDIYIPNVYNSWMIATTHFGVVPMTMDSWNAGTNQATFRLWAPWVFANYGTNDLTSVNHIQNELQAAATIYAAERGTVFGGSGFHAIGVNIEQQSACATLVDTTVPVSVGQTSDSFFVELDNAIVTPDPARTVDAGGSGGDLARFYCAQTFPFIYQAEPVAVGGGSPATIVINGGSYGQAANSDGIIIDMAAREQFATHGQLLVSNLSLPLYAPNVRFLGGFTNLSCCGSGGNSITNQYLDKYSSGHGAGSWDVSPFLPHTACCSYNSQEWFQTYGEPAVPFVGWRPDPSRTPNLPPALYSTVSGALGALGTYPVVNCETIYKSVDWNSGTLAHLYARSASCPMFSYGQTLDDSKVATSNSTFTGSVGGSPTTTTLTANPAGYILSNANLTVASNGTSGTSGGAFGNVTKSAGKLCFEETFTTATSGDTGVGLADSAATFPLDSTGSAVVALAGGSVQINGVVQFTFDGFSPGDTGIFCVNFDSNNVAVRNITKGETWNHNAANNPDIGGASISALTGVSALKSAAAVGASAADSVTINPTPSAGDLPTGYATWDSGATTALNISAVSSGAPALNAEITGTGIPAGVSIVSCPGGVCGGTGNYKITSSLVVGSETIKSYPQTMTWTYSGQSNVLYLDTTTLGWMFAGLAISVDNGGGSHAYIVTGVYPHLGYVTVTDGAADATVGNVALLAGTAGTIYSCSSSCTIGQAPYSWTQY